MNATGDELQTTCKILFLCTGNYYRSRFAEILFNTLAEEADLNWRALSRGIATDLGINNLGAMSIDAIRGLEAREIFVGDVVPFPMQLEERDLEDADLIIALKEAEHRLLLEKRFPSWPHKVEYWHIDDLDRAPAKEALVEIEQKIKRLILDLSKGGSNL